MPPKSKKDDVKDAQKLLWGRPGNGLKMGIVGLPNVGKSLKLRKINNIQPSIKTKCSS